VSTIRFEFYGVSVFVESPEAELIRRLRSDFSFFVLQAADPGRAQIRIQAFLSLPPDNLTAPSLGANARRKRVTRNCAIWDHGEARINRYGNEAWVEYRFGDDCAQVYSENLHRLHEVTYLLIQSRVGKQLDMKGLHRIHAMAIEKNGVIAVCSSLMIAH